MPKKRSEGAPEPAQPVADVARRQLFMAKQLCVRGGARASSALPVERVEGALLIDKAVETALNAMVDRFGSGPAEPAFPALWKAAQGLVGKHVGWELPFKAGVDHVHLLRTGVQHHGLVPSQEDASRASATAYEFIREVAYHVFDLDVDALALPEIIRNRSVAKTLSEAWALLEKGDNGGSVEASAQAFDQLWSLTESREAAKMGRSLGDSDTGWSPFGFQFEFSAGPSSLTEGLRLESDPLAAHFSKEQSRALRALRGVVVEVATALALGVQLANVRRFRAVVLKTPQDVMRDEAVFALDFAFDCALRSEFGSLELPEGQQV